MPGEGWKDEDETAARDEAVSMMQDLQTMTNIQSMQSQEQLLETSNMAVVRIRSPHGDSSFKQPDYVTRSSIGHVLPPMGPPPRADLGDLRGFSSPESFSQWFDSFRAAGSLLGWGMVHAICSMHPAELQLWRNALGLWIASSRSDQRRAW